MGSCMYVYNGAAIGLKGMGRRGAEEGWDEKKREICGG